MLAENAVHVFLTHSVLTAYIVTLFD